MVILTPVNFSYRSRTLYTASMFLWHDTKMDTPSAYVETMARAFTRRPILHRDGLYALSFSLGRIDSRFRAQSRGHRKDYRRLSVHLYHSNGWATYRSRAEIQRPTRKLPNTDDRICRTPWAPLSSSFSSSAIVQTRCKLFWIIPLFNRISATYCKRTVSTVAQTMNYEPANVYPHFNMPVFF